MIERAKRWYYPGVWPMLALISAGVWISVLSSEMPAGFALLGLALLVWMLYRLYSAEARWRANG
ncbi:hypothetical protein ACYJ1Y_14300 [Natrialbaceae archaeon A-gly3]